jgi:hypothetical protein
MLAETETVRSTSDTQTGLGRRETAELGEIRMKCGFSAAEPHTHATVRIELHEPFRDSLGIKEVRSPWNKTVAALKVTRIGQGDRNMAWRTRPLVRRHTHLIKQDCKSVSAVE